MAKTWEWDEMEREGRDEKTSTCDDCKIRGSSALSVSDAFANIQKEEWEDGGGQKKVLAPGICATVGACRMVRCLGTFSAQ